MKSPDELAAHQAVTDKMAKAGQVRKKATGLAQMIMHVCPDNAGREAALMNLEQAVMWAHSSIASGDPS